MTKVGTAQASERIEFQAGGMVLLFAAITPGPLSGNAARLATNPSGKPQTRATPRFLRVVSRRVMCPSSGGQGWLVGDAVAHC